MSVGSGHACDLSARAIHLITKIGTNRWVKISEEIIGRVRTSFTCSNWINQASRINKYLETMSYPSHKNFVSKPGAKFRFYSGCVHLKNNISVKISYRL